MSRYMRSRLPLAALLACAAAAASATQELQSPSVPPRCSVADKSGCLNGTTSGVPVGNSIQTAANNAAETTSQRTRKARGSTEARAGGPGIIGLPAGDALGGWGAWVGYTRSEVDSDVLIAPFSSVTHSGLVGIDRLLRDRVLVGVAGGLEDLTVQSPFNGGGQETGGYTVAPYLAVLIGEVFSIDVAGGFSELDNDQFRVNTGAAGPPILTASFDSERWFVATNLNASLTRGGWVLGGRVGFLRVEETQDGYTETGGPGSAARTVGERIANLSQLTVEASAGYTFGALEPYVSVAWRNDLARRDGISAGGLPGAVGNPRPGDDDDWRFGFGARWFGPAGVTASAEYVSTAGRDHTDEHNLSLTLRADF